MIDINYIVCGSMSCLASLVLECNFYLSIDLLFEDFNCQFPDIPMDVVRAQNWTGMKTNVLVSYLFDNFLCLQMW